MVLKRALLVGLPPTSFTIVHGEILMPECDPETIAVAAAGMNAAASVRTSWALTAAKDRDYFAFQRVPPVSDMSRPFSHNMTFHECIDCNF